MNAHLYECGVTYTYITKISTNAPWKRMGGACIRAETSVPCLARDRLDYLLQLQKHSGTTIRRVYITIAAKNLK